MLKFDRYKDGKRFALTFSYDDGCRQDRRLVELFNKYNMKATFNLMSESISDTSSAGIQEDEIRSLYIDNGHEVASHSASHPHLEQMGITGQYNEIIRSREILEKVTGTIVRGFAFPYGTYNADTLLAMDTASIAYGRSVKETGRFTLPEDFKVWHPTTHQSNAESRVKYFISLMEKEPWSSGGLLYIWGHGYEFDEPNTPLSWEKFEEFLTVLHTHKDDIWYATNIEIYDYVNSSRAIRISADETMLYNPTDTDIWVSNNGKPLCIGSCSSVMVK